MRVLYFAWLRSRVGVASEEVEPPPAVTDVAGLLDWLATLSPGHQAALADRRVVRVAINQDYAQPDAAVKAGDEIAIFPPVTGG
jgi:molybdopterin synthase sulfur carrier subunit